MLQLNKKFIFILIAIALLFRNIMALPLEAVFFDMDGVLVDTEYLKYQAWEQSLKEDMNIDFSLNEYIPLVGYSSKEILSKILSERKLEIPESIKKQLITKKNTLYTEKQKKGVKPIESAVVFLKKLLALKSSKNVKIGIASSASHDEIVTNLKFIGIKPNQLDAIISGSEDLKDIKDNTGTNKPKPYIYQKIANILGVNPQACIVFEDTNAGVLAAHDAGMRVYAVPNEYTMKHDFSNSIGIISFEAMNNQDAAAFLLDNGKIN